MADAEINLTGDVVHTEEFTDELDIESTNVPSGSEDEVEETEEVEADETEEAETDEGEEETAESDAEPEEEPEWFKKRFAKITKRAGEAEREAEALRQQVEQYKLAEAQKAQEQRQAVVSQPRPSLESFDYDEEAYATALTDWNRAQFEEQQTALSKEYQQKQQEQNYIQTYEQKRTSTVTSGQAKYADFDEAVGAMSGDVMSEKVALALFETKAPEDVAYYLAKNPEEAYRISQLPPIRVAMELARLESKATVPKKEVKTTNAPPPVKVVGKTADAGGEPDAKTDPDGWIKWERERCRKAGRRY